MHFARPVPPRTTKATVNFGSSLSPPVTSLAAALPAARVAEPASRPAGKQQPCCTSKSPRHRPGTFCCVPQCCAIGSRNIVFRYADDLMAGFEHREEAERLHGIGQHASALRARRHSERPTSNSPPGHFLVKLRRSRRQVGAQVATASIIPRREQPFPPPIRLSMNAR